VPWSIATDSDANLRYLFDSATMAWLLPNDNFGMGTYGGANMPALRVNNLARTTFADPRWSYPWMKQAGLIGSTRQESIVKVLDWMRQNLTHFFGAETFGNDYAIWQYRGYSPISTIVNGSIDSNNPSYGVRHWTAGCHGSVGFIHGLLRVLNIQTQPIWVCGHELIYFMSEDRYMDHGDDPYNANVRNSSASSALLLIDSPTYQGLFTTDLTINILDSNSPGCSGVGYTAAHF
jgi:hypothetical protein